MKYTRIEYYNDMYYLHTTICVQNHIAKSRKKYYTFTLSVNGVEKECQFLKIR